MKTAIVGLTTIFLLLCPSIYATMQKMDKIEYEGSSYRIKECPLNEYLASYRKGINYPEGKFFFDIEWTNNYKGYTAKWEIINDTLYLISFSAKKDGREFSINELFPNKNLPIKADWYTGEINILLGCVDLRGRKPTSSTTLTLKIERGVVLSKKKIESPIVEPAL